MCDSLANRRAHKARDPVKEWHDLKVNQRLKVGTQAMVDSLACGSFTFVVALLWCTSFASLGNVIGQQ